MTPAGNYRPRLHGRRSDRATIRQRVESEEPPDAPRAEPPDEPVAHLSEWARMLVVACIVLLLIGSLVWLLTQF